MVMRIGRTIPPAASPVYLKDIVSGIAGFFQGEGIVKRFEDELKSFYQVRYCFAVSSGKAALVFILQALHEIYPERNEVLIPAYTCYSVPSAIIRAGFKVRLCDMAQGTLDFDFDLLKEELDSPHLLCVIPTHLFGVPADVEQLRELIGQRNIFILEDAAQAMGAGWNGKKIGTQGDVGLFSMGRGKAFTTLEGGIILTDNDLIGQLLDKKLSAINEYGKLDCLKLILDATALSILIHPWIYWLPKLMPFLKLGETHFNTSFPIKRLSSFQAGMAKEFKTAISKLKEARLKNTQTIAECGMLPPGACREFLPDLIRYPVLAVNTEAKKKLLQKSEIMGLGLSDGYPDSIDGIAELLGFFDGKTFPVAKDIARRLFTLPVHQFVSARDVSKMAQLFN